MYWYRAFLALGRFSVVGTTVTEIEKMPEHLAVDEKHSRWRGIRFSNLSYILEQAEGRRQKGF